METLLESLRRNPILLQKLSMESLVFHSEMNGIWNGAYSNGSTPVSSAASSPDCEYENINDSVFKFPMMHSSLDAPSPYDRYGSSPMSPSLYYSDVEMEVQKILFGSSESEQEFSRKVFVGGLPSSNGSAMVTTEQLEHVFSKYGRLTIDWPNRDASQIGPTGGIGYAFAIFASPEQVPALLKDCKSHNGKLSLYVRMGNYHKLVQIRPWSNENRVWVARQFSDHEMKIYERNSIFLGGVPRTATAEELARLLTETIGNVLQVVVETDLETEYPKGAAKVVFASKEAYISAVARRVICFRTTDGQKEMEMKPYLDGSFKCDCCGQTWRHFCAELRCLKYLCENCWTTVHVGLENHRPMVRGMYHVRLMKTKDTVDRFQSSCRSMPPALLDLPFEPLYNRSAISFQNPHKHVTTQHSTFGDMSNKFIGNTRAVQRGPKMQLPAIGSERNSRGLSSLSFHNYF